MALESTDTGGDQRRPWWLPFVSLGGVLIVGGLWLLFYATDGRTEVIGMACLGAAAIVQAFLHAYSPFFHSW